MDIHLVVDPTPVVSKMTTSVIATLTAPEASVSRGVTTPDAVVVDLPAPPVHPEASREKNIEKSPVISDAASGEARTPPIPISVEDVVVGGLKESLAKASEFELCLRELASDAELLKTKMHVSTYVSPPPTRVRITLRPSCFCSHQYRTSSGGTS